MAWSFEERQSSGKFTVSDDGSARAVISLIASSDGDPVDPSPCEATAGDTAGLLTALKAAFPIGGTVGNPSNWPAGSVHTKWAGKWRIDGYSGAIPASSDSSVWYIEVHISWAGNIEDLQGTYTTVGRPRRDVEIMISGQSRRANAFADWYTVDLPTHGDADPLAAMTGTIDRIDVNGSGVSQVIPGARITINALIPFQPDKANYLAGAYIGQRNKSELLDWGRGALMCEAIEGVQVGHGFQRLTVRLYADAMLHLQQEVLSNTATNAPMPTTDTTTVDGIVIRHMKACFRQPYGLTTATNAWDLDDLFYFDTSIADYLAEIIPNL